jgi:hypothetical protein
MSDPISIFRAAAAAIESEAWDEAAALCDPATLSLYKREILSRIAPPKHPWTAERLLRASPDLPREVAEFQAMNLAKMSDPQRVLDDEVPSISSIEQLRDMPPLKVFAAWLQGQSYTSQLARAQRNSSMPAEVIVAALQRPFKTRYHILGVVDDGERLTYVVFRREYDSPSSDDEIEPPGYPEDLSDAELSALEDQQNAYVDFAPLRRQPDGSWRLLAGHGFLGRNNPVFAFGFGGESDEDDG